MTTDMTVQDSETLDLICSLINNSIKRINRIINNINEISDYNINNYILNYKEQFLEEDSKEILKIRIKSLFNQGYSIYKETLGNIEKIIYIDRITSSVKFRLKKGELDIAINLLEKTLNDTRDIINLF